MDNTGPVIDMRPDGSFAPAAPPPMRISGTTLLLVAGGIAVGAVALAVWLAVTLLPMILALVLLGLSVRAYRRWRNGGRGRRATRVPTAFMRR